MCPLEICLVWIFYSSAVTAQSTRFLHGKINDLETRYERHSYRTSEKFKELWDHMYKQESVCCQAKPTEAVTAKAPDNSEIDSTPVEEYERLKNDINVLKNGLTNEKEAVRQWIDSVEKAVEGLNATWSAKLEGYKSESYANTKGFCTCSEKWVKIFENGPNGESLFGDRNDLIQAALTGSSVKIIADKSYMTSVQNLRPVNGQLMAQALFQISTSNRKFQDDAYWMFVLASTTGHWYMSRYNVGEHVSRGDNETKYGMEWFIRRPCDGRSVLRVLPDGTIAHGSKRAAISAVRNGYPIRLTSMKTGYTFPADNLEVAGNEVAVQSLWHLSQKYSVDKQRLIFQEKAYWLFTMWATTGKKQMSRWTVGSHESRGRTEDSASTEWFVDPCWKLVYRHGPHGETIEGNKTLLIDSVQKGHRARIVYKNISFELNLLTVFDGEVGGLFMDSVSKVSFYQFEDNTGWIFHTASTNGEILNFKPPDGRGSGTTEQGQIAWFVDTREWKEALTVAKTGAVIRGSKSDLVKYVEKGSDVRFTFQSKDKPYLYMSAENIHIFPKEFMLLAMNTRCFLPLYQISRWFTLINSEGLLDISLWVFGEHKVTEHFEKRTRIVWFVSE